MADRGQKDLTTMRLSVSRPMALALVLCVLAGGAVAQSNSDVRPLLDRLDRLERDMNLLQRQIYRSNTGPGGTPVAVTPADGGSALSYEVRIGQIEEQIRALTGQVEEVNFHVDELKRRFDKLASDIDLRLGALEHPGGAPAAAAVTPAPGRGGVNPAAPRGAGANPAEPPSQSGVLGQVPVGGTVDQSPAAAGESGEVTPAALPSGSAQDQYNRAFGLLRQADYPAAEQALRAFIQRYPNDPLAGNAQYWLGETYYVRKDYNGAAAAFAEGYQKYPKGGKAADNLLKLGMALGFLGQKADSCRAYSRLDRDFPNSPARDRGADEKKRLGC
jgi:tol-pal system protein YbgF